MYYDTLEQFEDWNSHTEVLISCFGTSNLRINRAMEIVEKYHNQPRTVGVGNYNRHPVRVARILIEEMSIKDEATVLIALCHDLAEWTDYEMSHLKAEFGDEVANAVHVLTWSQEGEWSEFVATIVASGITNLLAIKIADKLDNNRAAALSGSFDEKIKAKAKTIEVILPLVERHYPDILDVYRDSLVRLG